MLVQRAVTERGFAVSGPFPDRAGAIGAIEAGGIAAALLDVSLADGQTSAPVAEALRTHGVPFAFVTGYGPETGVVASAFPGSLVIPKPVDPDTVGLILDELVGQTP